MKKNYLMEIIREEISSYLGENEPMYASPQDQQREMNGMLDQVENLKKLRDDLDAQIAQLESIANTFNVNEAGLFGLKDPKNASKGFAATLDPDDATEKSPEFLSKYKKLSEEEQLDEMAKISEPIQNAITIAIDRLKSQFPDITAGQITNIITSKKKSPEYAPELVKALEDDEKMHGGDINYSPGIKGPQTLRAVEKALGEYEPGARGRKATEKPATAPKAKSFNKAPITKKNYEPKPVSDLTDDEGNPIEVDTTFKTATGNKELEDKLKDVIAKKKIKLAKAEGADYDKEVAALKQFLAKPEIAKYIAKKTVNGVNPYSIDNILK